VSAADSLWARKKDTAPAAGRGRGGSLVGSGRGKTGRGAASGLSRGSGQGDAKEESGPLAPAKISCNWTKQPKVRRHKNTRSTTLASQTFAHTHVDIELGLLDMGLNSTTRMWPSLLRLQLWRRRTMAIHPPSHEQVKQYRANGVACLGIGESGALPEIRN